MTPQNAPTATLEAVEVLPTATTGAAQPTQPPTQPPAEPTLPPAEPTQPPAESTTAPSTGAFLAEDLVIVNDNDVNMRVEPSTTADIVDTLTQGAELRVLSSTPTTSPTPRHHLYLLECQRRCRRCPGWVVGDFLEK